MTMPAMWREYVVDPEVKHPAKSSKCRFSERDKCLGTHGDSKSKAPPKSLSLKMANPRCTRIDLGIPSSAICFRGCLRYSCVREVSYDARFQRLGIPPNFHLGVSPVATKRGNSLLERTSMFVVSQHLIL